MKTNLLYLSNTYLYESAGTIIETGSNEKGQFLVFDSTIFYPRGGGQDSDIGKIKLIKKDKEINITFVEVVGDKVLHYGSLIDGDLIGTQVMQYVDNLVRNKNAILHSSGHLIASIVELKYPFLRAVKGFHFPEGSNVEFTMLDQIEFQKDELHKFLVDKMKTEVNKGLLIYCEEKTLEELKKLCKHIPANLPKNKPLRVATIESYFPIPCGGTHVKSTSELAFVEITKVKMKKGNLKVSYKLKDF